MMCTDILLKVDSSKNPWENGEKADYPEIVGLTTLNCSMSKVFKNQTAFSVGWNWELISLLTTYIKIKNFMYIFAENFVSFE